MGYLRIKSREVARIAIRMIRPPMVGVPAFFKWDCTPSALSVCPTLSFRRKGITKGLKTTLITKAVNNGIITSVPKIISHLFVILFMRQLLFSTVIPAHFVLV